MMKERQFLCIVFVFLMSLFNNINGMSFEQRIFNSPIKKQAQVACQANNIKKNRNYVCTKFGDIVCLFGWKNESSLCSEPLCVQKCNSDHGKCTGPNTCTCDIGWEGSSCDQCLRLPGCQNGYCDKPYECKCKPGWQGTFCEEPVCKEGCANGFCSSPQECLCKPGWTGDNCTECEKLPGCSMHGGCNKPLECNCEEGWFGNFCQFPICHSKCHPENGYCNNPNECRCHVGWQGTHCNQCTPYPGCKGDCKKPWDCICRPGQYGPLCDSSQMESNFTEMNPKITGDDKTRNTKEMDNIRMNITLANKKNPENGRESMNKTLKTSKTRT